MGDVNINKPINIAVLTVIGRRSVLFGIQDERKLRFLIVLIMTILLGSIYILPVNLALAVECKEIAKKIKVYESHKKIWEQSLNEWIKVRDIAQSVLFRRPYAKIKGLFNPTIYTLSETMALCLTFDNLVITSLDDDDEGLGKKDCNEVKKAFDSRHQDLTKKEDQVIQIQQNIRDLERKLLIAERHFQDNNCADRLLPGYSLEEWKESGPQGWSGTWTRQGNSHLYEVVWTKGNNTVTATVDFYRVEGNEWEGRRIKSSDGVICTYYGTISDDEGIISGDGHCTNDTKFKWSANIIKK